MINRCSTPSCVLSLAMCPCTLWFALMCIASAGCRSSPTGGHIRDCVVYDTKSNCLCVIAAGCCLSKAAESARVSVPVQTERPLRVAVRDARWRGFRSPCTMYHLRVHRFGPLLAASVRSEPW